MLTTILAEGNSSRLYKALVDSGLATMAGASYEEHFDPYLMQFYVVAAGEGKTAQIESVLYAEIDKLIKDGVSKEEVQKARSQKLMRFYKQLETINGKANTLGTYEMFFGDFKKLFEAPKAYEAVTAADIQRVAAEYLKKSRRTVGILAAKEE